MHDSPELQNVYKTWIELSDKIDFFYKTVACLLLAWSCFPHIRMKMSTSLDKKILFIIIISFEDSKAMPGMDNIINGGVRCHCYTRLPFY